tara:strand:- start:692 stop:2005 length:1314 start_codon:yes stop_codon:yes gene_type:complete
MPGNNIKDIKSRFILDSRGNPTVEAEVILEDGTTGRASAPSGASTGDKEALELRDNDLSWHGKGVNQAVVNIQKTIKPQLIGLSPLNVDEIDQALLNIDGTENKSKLGANSMLAVSLANIKAGAKSSRQYLYEYIFQYINKTTHTSCGKITMPTPMMNILNGGSHADNTVDFQEFMIMPVNFSGYKDVLQCGTEIFHTLKNILKTHGHNTSIGDEGGFAPNLKSNEEAIDLILSAIAKAGYADGKDVFIALDVAASEFFLKKEKKYFLESENKKLTSIELIEYYKNLCSKYPIISIEDGLDQNDWESWQTLNKTLGKSIQIVGDDLTVTNPKLLKKAINLKSMNAILVKLNQIGTFSETIETIQLAKKNKFNTIISHRSGETEDTFISDLAVATNAGQIKTGSLCRTDRTAKYNQLLRIEESMNFNVKLSKPKINFI